MGSDGTVGREQSIQRTLSLRRTKASLVYQTTGNNAEIFRQLLGYTSIASTSAYLNVEKNEALEVARRVEI